MAAANPAVDTRKRFSAITNKGTPVHSHEESAILATSRQRGFEASTEHYRAKPSRCFKEMIAAGEHLLSDRVLAFTTDLLKRAPETATS